MAEELQGVPLVHVEQRRGSVVQAGGGNLRCAPSLSCRAALGAGESAEGVHVVGLPEGVEGLEEYLSDSWGRPPRAGARLYPLGGSASIARHCSPRSLAVRLSLFGFTSSPLHRFISLRTVFTRPLGKQQRAAASAAVDLPHEHEASLVNDTTQISPGHKRCPSHRGPGNCKKIQLEHRAERQPTYSSCVAAMGRGLTGVQSGPRAFPVAGFTKLAEKMLSEHIDLKNEQSERFSTRRTLILK